VSPALTLVDSIAPGTVLGVGETATRIAVVRIGSHDECTALSNQDRCASFKSENRFVVSFIEGAAECRVVLVCAPDPPPPTAAAAQ